MKNCVGELGWPKCVGKLGWVNREMLELECPTACTCLFKLRPGVLSKTLTHMCGKLNLPIFLLNVGLLILINMDPLMFLAKPCPPSLLFETQPNLPTHLSQPNSPTQFFTGSEHAHRTS